MGQHQCVGVGDRRGNDESSSMIVTMIDDRRMIHPMIHRDGDSSISTSTHIHHRFTTHTTMNPNLQQQLLEIENLATQQYMHANPAATAALSSFRTSSECIPQSRLILDHSSNPHALYLAADSLGELLPNYFHTFTGAQTLEIRNYLLNWLASAVLGQRVTHDYVLRKMCTTIALFSKIAWRQVS